MQVAQMKKKLGTKVVKKSTVRNSQTLTLILMHVPADHLVKETLDGSLLLHQHPLSAGWRAWYYLYSLIFTRHEACLLEKQLFRSGGHCLVNQN
jgi:hypothetical protein